LFVSGAGNGRNDFKGIELWCERRRGGDLPMWDSSQLAKATPTGWCFRCLETSELSHAEKGAKNIQHTVRYTELSPTRFKDFWR
jgi:hypothetical protein